MKQHMQKERKKEKTKEQDAKRGGKKAEAGGGAGRMATQQKGAGSEASKLGLQLTTMPSLAHAPYHDELLLETRPWRTSSAPRCYLDGSGSEPWQSSPQKVMAAWSLRLP